jgi:predicted transposase/invertase (TIGR01784 family)
MTSYRRTHFRQQPRREIFYVAELINPHDHFFKEILSRQEEAKDFVLHYLPEGVVELLDTETLELTKDSFVDQELRGHFSDLLYRVQLRSGQGAYLYLLFEHKSRPEGEIAFQLLRYMVRIWEQDLKQRARGPLLPILPCVVYHGETAWRIPLDFHALVATPEELMEFCPDFRYLVCDLSQYPDEAIKGVVTLRVALLVLKYIFRTDLEERLPEILGVLRELTVQRTGLEYLETVLRYLVRATDRVSEEGLQKALESVLPATGGVIMPTLAEKWFQEGMQQGLEQGRRGIRQELLGGIELGVELKFGSEGVRLLSEIYKIEDLDLLRAIREGLKTVHSLEEFQRIYRS